MWFGWFLAQKLSQVSWDALPLRAMAWDKLREMGSRLVDQYQAEFVSPWKLSLMFEDYDSATDLVRDMAPEMDKEHIESETIVLNDWLQESEKEIRADCSAHMLAAKRYKVETKACPCLPDAYNALVGLSVSLRTFVSKTLYRRKLADPQATKDQLEFATREYWLCVWAGMLKEACLPVCTIADATSDPMAVLRAALGTRRVGTLRARARSWKTVRAWLMLHHDVVHPQHVAHMLDYILFLEQDGATVGKVKGVAAAFSVIEEAGQVRMDERLSTQSIWKNAMETLVAKLQTTSPDTKKAPPFTVAICISLEISILSQNIPSYLRAVMWIMLLCCWCCMRVSDLEGLDSSRMLLNENGFKAVLKKTKTTGPDKRIKEVPIFVGRTVGLTGLDWMKAGYLLWKDYHAEPQTSFVLCASHDWSHPLRKRVSPETIASYFRYVLNQLRPPFKDPEGRWRLSDVGVLGEGELYMFWSGHSPRHFLPTVSAAVGIEKEQRDYLGRWHLNLRQSQDYALSSKQIVHKIQSIVCERLCKGNPGYMEHDVFNDMKEHMRARGVEESVIKHQIELHTCLKKVDSPGSLPTFCLGQSWPHLALLWESSGLQEDVALDVAQTLEEPGLEPIQDQPDGDFPYFVTISRRTGFRRLHQKGLCGIWPWQCQHVEYLKSIHSASAHAVCKRCIQRSGLATSSEQSDTSSGSSSSTDSDEKVPVCPLPDVIDLDGSVAGDPVKSEMWDDI